MQGRENRKKQKYWLLHWSLNHDNNTCLSSQHLQKVVWCKCAVSRVCSVCPDILNAWNCIQVLWKCCWRPCLAGFVSGEAPAQQEHRTGVLQGSGSHWFPWKPEPEQGRAKLQHPCLLSESKMGCQTFTSLGSSGCVWGLFIRSKPEVGYQ